MTIESIHKKKHIYFHVSKMKNWKGVYWELMFDLEHSGLLDSATTVNIVTVGTEKFDFEPIPPSTVIETTYDVDSFEFPTQQLMYEHALREPDALFCYIHTKGVSAPRDKGKLDWRRDLSSFVIWEWLTRVIHLDHICTSGPRLQYGPVWNTGNKKVPVYGFYSGNFWWARGSYIAQLPSPMSLLEEFKERMWAEAWIGGRKDFNLPPLTTE